MSVDTLTFELPMPDSRNDKRRHAHWATVHKRTQAYYALCKRVVGLQGLTLPRGWPALLATATCHVHGSNDEGNAIARLKPLEDWIVLQGVVPSDARRHWHWTAIPGEVLLRSKKETPYVRLTITRSDEHRQEAA